MSQLRVNTITNAGGTGSTYAPGHVVQVVNGAYSTQVTTTGGSYTDTGLSASITPKFATSKILIIVDQAGCSKSGTDTSLQLRLVRNGSVLYWFDTSGGWTGSNATTQYGSTGTSYLDSPASASAITYKTEMAAWSPNGGTVRTQTSVGNGFPVSTITLMEIAQ